MLHSEILEHTKFQQRSGCHTLKLEVKNLTKIKDRLS